MTEASYPLRLYSSKQKQCAFWKRRFEPTKADVTTAFMVLNEATEYTSTTITAFGAAAREAKAQARKPSKLLYYWRVIRWMWRHKDEPNNRAKWRRMAREIGV